MPLKAWTVAGFCGCGGLTSDFVNLPAFVFASDSARVCTVPSGVVPVQQGLHGQVVSPMQAQVLHHFREPDSMRVARRHGSSP